MENYNTEAVISARDDGFTSTIDSVLSSLKNLEGASESAVKSVESCADAISGLMDSVAGTGDIQALCSAMKTFGSVTKTAFDQVMNLSGKMSSILEMPKTIASSMSKVKDLASEAGEAPKSAAKNMESLKKSIADLYKGSKLDNKVHNMGVTAKGMRMMYGNKLANKSFKKDSENGRFSGDGPIALKAMDQVRNKVSEITPMIKKIGPVFQSASKVGLSAMSGMASGMASVMGVGLKAIGPAAVAGVALAGLGALQGQFGEQINGLLQIAVEQGPQIIQSLVDGIVNSLPAFMEAGSGLLVNLLDAITVNLPVAMQGGLQIISALIQGLIANLPQIVPAALNLLTTFATSIIQFIPQLIGLGLQLLMGLAQGLMSGDIIGSVMTIMTTLINTIVASLPTLIQMGLQLIAALIMGIVNNLPQIIASGIQLILMLITGIGSMLPQILAAGWEIIKSLGMGIIQAIPEILTSVIEGIKNLFSGLWDFITGKNEEGAASTADSMQQMADGMKNTTYDASFTVQTEFSNMTTMGSASAAGLSDSVFNLGNTIQSVPVDRLVEAEASCGESVAAIENNISDGMNRITDSATNAMAVFGQVLQAGMANAQNLATSGMNSIINALMSMLPSMQAVGAFAMSGLANGIYNSAHLVYDAAREVANGISRIMNDALKVGSPSKVTTKIGEYAGIGPAIGMLNMLPKVEKASARLAEAMQPVVTSDFLGAGRYGSGSGRISVSAEGQAMTNAYLRMVLNDIREAVCEQGNKTYVFEAPLNLEGKQIAKASAVYTQEEINRKEKLLKRMGGYR